MPKTPLSKPRRLTPLDAARKPLLGFGWAGWVLLSILVVMIVSLAAGHDLRYRLQELIMHTLGVDAMMQFTIQLSYLGICFGTWPPHEHVGPLTLCIILLALHLHPRRVGALRLLPLWGFATVGPLLWFRLFLSLSFQMRGEGRPELAMLVSASIWWAVGLVVLWWAVRSWRIALPIGLVLLLPLATHALPWLEWEGYLSESVVAELKAVQRHAGLAMNAALALILIPWGLRERLRVLPPHACQACGYDLRGLDSPTCPECGTLPQPPIDSPLA